MAKTGKKKAIAAAAAVLVLLAAALAAWLSLSVRVGDRRYRRADVIDARAAALSCAEYDAAAQENPSARIRWSVPLGGERFDSFSEELVLSALPESEIERLGYFPSLRHVDAEGCTDYPALAAAAAKFPAVSFSWHIPAADGLSFDALAELIPLLPRLEEVALEKSALSGEEAAALGAEFPALRLRGAYPVWGLRADSDAAVLDLTGKSGPIGELTALSSALGGLETIKLGPGALPAADYAALKAAFPDTEIAARVMLGDTEIDPQAEELLLNDRPMTEPEALRALIGVMPRLKKVELCGSGLSDAEMETLCAQYPDVDFVWLITFGGGRFTVRTDLVSFSTLRTHFGEVQHRFTDEELAPLFRYSRHLRALDLGHNYICDITPIGELKELRILILGDNPYLEDFSPLGNLTELEYLELFNSHIDYDFSFLYHLHKIRYLNLSYFSALDDIAYIDGMPDLKMFWLRGTAIPNETAADYAARRPDVLFHYGNCGWEASATCHGWRKTETNILVRTLFRSWRDVVAINGLDDVRFDPDATVIFCNPLEA